MLAALELWLLAQWLGINIGFAPIALGVTGGALASVIPISLAGAGPAELGAGLLFAAVALKSLRQSTQPALAICFARLCRTAWA